MRPTIALFLSLLLAGSPATSWAALESRGKPTGIGAPILPSVSAAPPLQTPAGQLPSLIPPSLPALAVPELRVQNSQAPQAEAARLDAIRLSAIASVPALPSAGLSELPAEEARGALAPIFGEGVPPSAPAAPSALSGTTPGAPFFVRHHKLLRVAALPLVRLLYKVDVASAKNLPPGPALIVPNHVAYVDALIVGFAADRPLRFLMLRSIYETRGLKWLFRALGAIPISSRDGKEKIEASLNEARQALKAGQSVVIFPEGALTHNGNMIGFRRGFEKIAEGSDAAVVPAHLDGLWGSLFSRKKEPVLRRLLQAPRRVIVRFGPALKRVTAQAAREAVQELSADSLAERIAATGKTLPRAFLETAKKRWKRPAVADSTGKELSFGETLTGSVLLAGLLRARLPDNKNVGVLLPPSAGGVLANTALGMLGKVPVNLNYTASRQAVDHAVGAAGLSAVVTSRKFIEALKAKGAPLPGEGLLYLEDLLPLVPKWKKALTYAALRILPRWAVEALFLREAPRDLSKNATILFTSGSSALPKGVELSHANILSNIEMVRAAFPWSGRDAMLGVLPFFHSFGYTITLWMPLLLGLSAAYHTHPLESEAIAKLARKHLPTMLLGTPTFLQRYAQKIPAEAFAKLRLVVAGAEKLRGSIADDFEKKFGARPYEGYGATELSPVASANLPDAGPQKGGKEGSVGRPLPGIAARVVDPETLEVLPYGEQGMLLIKGPNVMKGYLGEPAKTAEVLKDGWYVTGDLASIDREGFITLAGRLTRFSKIAGEMISHVAVEEKLQAAAGLSEQVFVVTAAPDERRGERLVVLHAGYEGDIGALLEKAKALGLPGLWTPAKSAFHKVEAIPVLGTGKLDLKAIKELALQLEASSR